MEGLIEILQDVHQVFDSDTDIYDGAKVLQDKPIRPSVGEGEFPHEQGPSGEVAPVEERLAWDVYEDVVAMRDIVWEDVEEMRYLARRIDDGVADNIIIGYKEDLRAMGYALDRLVDVDAQRYINQDGYPANMSRELFDSLRHEYALRRTGFMTDMRRLGY
ncbi:MAG: hypothetical protein ACJKTH_00385 [Patescibacteria group bacterium UBA2163]